MKRVKSIFALVLGLSAIASSISPASAIPYNGNDVYKVTENGQTSVYISGTANGTATVALGYVDRFSSRVAGACGEIRLSASSVGMTPTIQVAGSTVTLSSLPSQLLPSCTNGVFAEARTQNFKTPAGDIVIVGQTPGSAVLINVPKDTNKSVKINNCGFGTLRNSTSFSIPATFSVNGSSKTLSSLPSAMNSPRCTSGVGYVPASWLGSGSGT
jgi:hypothetical protein